MRVRIPFLTLFLVSGLCLGSLASLGAERSLVNGRRTPMPPKYKFDPIARMDPAVVVPSPLAAYTFQTTGEVDGIKFYDSTIPMYFFNPNREPAGDIAVGSEFKPEFIKSFSGRHFYGVSREEQVGADKIKKVAWIDGRFLKVVAFDPRIAKLVFPD